MKRFLALVLALLPLPSQADVVFNYDTGLSLYVRFDDASNTAVNLTEGSTLKLGRYVAADAAIDAAGLGNGKFVGRIFIGTAGAQSSGDVLVGVVPRFEFNGTTEVIPTDAIQTAVANVPTVAEFEARTPDNKPLVDADGLTRVDVREFDGLATIDSLSPSEVLAAILSVSVGKISGSATNTPAIRSADDTVTRVTAETNQYGDRTSITLDLSGIGD